MRITNFALPNTKMCIVRWYRDGRPTDTLIPTPPNNEQLATAMLNHRVGVSEIRAVKPVDSTTLLVTKF